MLREVNERVVEYELNLDATDVARDWLAENGFNPEFGARPLRRTMQMEIEDRLSDAVLAGEFKAGDDILIDVRDDKIILIADNQRATNHVTDTEEEELDAVPML